MAKILRRALVLAVFACTAANLQAEPAVAQFAPYQLRNAQAELERARAAFAGNDYAGALRLAALAGLDARLAWAMTESQAVRRAALEVSAGAERLRLRGVLAASRAP